MDRHHHYGGGSKGHYGGGGYHGHRSEPPEHRVLEKPMSFENR